MVNFYDWLTIQLKELLPDVVINEIENMPIAAVGLDSLELLDLIMLIEDEYGVEIDLEDLNKTITVAQIRQLIES